MKKDFIISTCNLVVSPFFQIIALFTTLCLAIFLAYEATYEFDPHMAVYHLHPVTPQSIIFWGGTPPQIEVGLHIFNFSEFDLLKNKFTFEGTVWFDFDPALISLDTIEKFSFEHGNILKKTEAQAKLIDDKLFVSYDVQVSFGSDLIHRAFPLDDHRLNIVLTNLFVSPRELIFIGSGKKFTRSEAVFTAGWTIENMQVRFGFSQGYLDQEDERKLVEHPKAVFSLDLKRTGLRDVLVIFLPLFLIFFISVFALSFNPVTDKSNIYYLGAGAVPSMITYRFVIQNMAPNVGYFMLSDQIFNFFLIFALIHFVFCVFLGQSKELTYPLIVIRAIIFFMYHLIFLTVWWWLLFYWINL